MLKGWTSVHCAAPSRTSQLAHSWHAPGRVVRWRLRCATGVRPRAWGWVWGRKCGPEKGGRDALLLSRPVARRRRNLHLRHHAISEPRARRKLRKLHQLKNDLPFTFGFDAAERAIGEMHSPGGGQQALRPELDFIGIEVHGDVSHFGVLRPGCGPGFTPGDFPDNHAMHYGPDGYKF